MWTGKLDHLHWHERRAGQKTAVGRL